jgi:hypothetical protein
MLNRVRSLVTVLVLTLPGVASAGDGMSVFLKQQKYTYCDAKFLSVLWKTSVSDAKTTIGGKVFAKQEATLDAALPGARKAAAAAKGGRCTFHEAGFSYTDAQKLAKLWKVPESTAKTKAEDKILAGGEKGLRSILKSAPAGSGDKPADPLGTFLKQDRYSGCEVKLLSKLWKTTAKDAKVRIGTKLAANDTKYIETELTSARGLPKMKCTIADAGFTAWDMQRLAKMWEMSVKEVTPLIEKKIFNGATSMLRETLKNNVADDDVTAFGNQTKYTYCDAKMIGGLWKQSTGHGKAFIGAKVAAKQTGALDRTLKSARANAVKETSARCGYHEAGFSYDDVMILAKLWKLDPEKHDVKAEVSLRIAKGQEAAMKKQLEKNKPKTTPPLTTPPMPKPPTPKTGAIAPPPANLGEEKHNKPHTKGL